MKNDRIKKRPVSLLFVAEFYHAINQICPGFMNEYHFADCHRLSVSVRVESQA